MLDFLEDGTAGLSEQRRPWSQHLHALGITPHQTKARGRGRSNVIKVQNFEAGECPEAPHQPIAEVSEAGGRLVDHRWERDGWVEFRFYQLSTNSEA